MRVLVTGAGGQLGRDLTDALRGDLPPGGVLGDPATGRIGRRARCDVVALGHEVLNVADRDAVASAVEGTRPDVVVHAAAWTAVDACEGDPDRAFAVNAAGTRHVVEAARRSGAHVLYVSTDYVFDGRSARPYVEWDEPNPLSVYGRSKRGGELELGPSDCVVRTSWVCGARGANMVRTVLRLASSPGPLSFVDDQHGCPTFTADLAGVVATLALDRRPGVFHVTNAGPTTWFEFAQAVLRAAGEDPGRVVPIATAELDPPRPALRPANSVLENAALRHCGMAPLPAWQEALARLVDAVSDEHGSARAWATGGAR